MADTDSEDGASYDVEKILDTKIGEDGHREFLLKWEGTYTPLFYGRAVFGILAELIMSILFLQSLCNFYIDSIIFALNGKVEIST